MRAGRVILVALLLLPVGCKKKAATSIPPLQRAARDGDVQRVRALIAGGADIRAASYDGKTPLHAAAGDGHLDIVQVLVAAGADVNAVDGAGNTPLLSAMLSDRLEVAKYLAGKGAIVTTANKSGRTPLGEAISYGDLDLVRSLIAHGADVNEESLATGYTPLKTAARVGDGEVVELLLSKGADINTADMWGFTALHEALNQKHADVARLLLARGAKATTRTYDGETLLHAAARLGCEDIVTSLIAGDAEVNAVDKPGDTPLLYAARCGHLEVVRRLIAEGAIVEVANKSGQMPLGEAAKYGDPAVVKLLIAHGADVNAKCDVYYGTPLHIAAEYGWKLVAEALIDAGAELNSRDNLGQTPALVAMKKGHSKVARMLASRGADMTIHLAAYLGDMEKVKQLLESGIDVDAQDDQGWTALRWAVHDGHEKVVQILLARGADVNGKGPGDTPLLDALWRRHINVATLLVNHGSRVDGRHSLSGDSPLRIAAQDGLTELARLLIEKEADVDATDNSGNTALHCAVLNGRRETAELLVSRGADVNSKGCFSDSSLHEAAEMGYKELAQWLIEKGALVDQRNDFGQTPAASALEAGHKEIVRLLAAQGADLTIHLAAYVGDSRAVSRLLEAGTEIDLQDKDGRTPLYLAAQEGNVDVVRLLIARGADVNRRRGRDSWTPTPLHAAANRGRAEVVDLLLHNGADVHATDLIGTTPLIEAARQGHKEVVESLIVGGAKVNAQDQYGRTPLLEAALHGHLATVEFLLAQGADVTAGQMKKDITMPEPAPRMPGEMARFLVHAYMPYTSIVTDRQAVRQFLKFEGIPLDDVWIPDQADIQGLGAVLESYLRENHVPPRCSWFDCEYVLHNLRQYRREFSGFVDDGVKYVLCSMILTDEYRSAPPNRFSIVFDGGCSVVRVIFNAETREIFKIECNGN